MLELDRKSGTNSIVQNFVTHQLLQAPPGSSVKDSSPVKPVKVLLCSAVSHVGRSESTV